MKIPFSILILLLLALRLPSQTAFFEYIGAGQGLSLGFVTCLLWYRSFWAIFFYILATLGLFYFLLRSWMRRQKIEKELEMEHREAERILQLDKLKTEIYDNISKEFLTPLMVILGMSEKAEQYTNEQETTKVYQSIALIKRNAQYLLRLTNQMLDLSKLEFRTFKLNLVQGNVVVLLKYMMESFHTLARAKNIRLHFLPGEEAILMDYDKERLLDILSNLLSNALNNTPPGGDIYLQLARQPGYPAGKAADKLVLTIKDTGDGIHPKPLTYLFDRFYQVSDAQLGQSFTNISGTGIGLALVKELVNLMSGTISVKSKPGAGAEFTVEIPINNTAPLEEQTEMAVAWENELTHFPGFEIGTAEVFMDSMAGNKAGFPLVLNVAGNPDVASYIAACVGNDYSIIFASNAEEGIQRAIEATPHMIVSDLMMPDNDGLALCDVLKSDERTSHIPIVLLAAQADLAKRLENSQHGADAYLPKPFRKEQLMTTLQKLRQNLKVKSTKEALSKGNSSSTEQLDNITRPESEMYASNEFLNEVTQLLDNHLDDVEFSVVEMSRRLGMSRSQLYRKIKALTGKPINLFVRSYRLQKGRDLLKNTDMTIAEIAYKVGFTDPSYFSRSFFEEFGELPSASRK